MTRKKATKKEVSKLILTGALAISVFGGTFIIANHYVLASSYDKAVSLPTSYQESAPKLKKSSDYVKADYKVKVDEGHISKNPNIISADEAAEIGAQYLWDVYKVDLSQKTIHMSYSADPSRAIGYWYGTIYEEDSEEESLKYMSSIYSFGIEAISGKRDSISYENNEEVEETIPYLESEMNRYYKKNSKEFLKLAKQFAEHNLPSKPVKAKFIGTGAGIAQGYEYETQEGAIVTMIPENEEEIDIIKIPLNEKIPAKHVYVEILVSDANKNEVFVTIDVTDKHLAWMNNKYNGIDYDPGSIG